MRIFSQKERKKEIKRNQQKVTNVDDKQKNSNIQIIGSTKEENNIKEQNATNCSINFPIIEKYRKKKDAHMRILTQSKIYSTKIPRH